MGNLKRTHACGAVRQGIIGKLSTRDYSIPSGQVISHQRSKQVSKASIDDLSLIVILRVIRDDAFSCVVKSQKCRSKTILKPKSQR